MTTDVMHSDFCGLGKDSTARRGTGLDLNWPDVLG
jgi:hypothetical protein